MVYVDGKAAGRLLDQIGFRHESPKPGLMSRLLNAIKVPNGDNLSEGVCEDYF